MESILSDSDFYSSHETRKRKRLFFIGIAAFLVIAAAVLSCFIGDFNISPFSLLSGNLGERERYVFFNIRLIRVLTAVISGAGLALCGAVIQNLLKNPMASPFTLGISQGAAFGASFAIIFLGAGITSSYGDGVIISSFPVTVFAAFLGALSCSAFVFSVAYFRGGDANTVILSGIACGAFFQAMTMFIQYFTSEVKAAATLFWTFGDVSKAGWDSLLLMSVFFVFIFSFFMLSAIKLNALLWGRETAKTLGVRVKSFTLAALLAVSALSAVITSFLGVIAFVGLIAPHLSRLAVGHDNRYFLPLSALTGALVLLISDILSRILLPPSVIPVGIITSFWGITVLLFLLLKREKC